MSNLKEIALKRKRDEQFKRLKGELPPFVELSWELSMKKTEERFEQINKMRQPDPTTGKKKAKIGAGTGSHDFVRLVFNIMKLEMNKMRENDPDLFTYYWINSDKDVPVTFSYGQIARKGYGMESATKKEVETKKRTFRRYIERFSDADVGFFSKVDRKYKDRHNLRAGRIRVLIPKEFIAYSMPSITGEKAPKEEDFSKLQPSENQSFAEKRTNCPTSQSELKLKKENKTVNGVSIETIIPSAKADKDETKVGSDTSKSILPQVAPESAAKIGGGATQSQPDIDLRGKESNWSELRLYSLFVWRIMVNTIFRGLQIENYQRKPILEAIQNFMSYVFAQEKLKGNVLNVKRVFMIVTDCISIVFDQIEKGNFQIKYGALNYLSLDKKENGEYVYQTACFRQVYDTFYPKLETYRTAWMEESPDKKVQDGWSYLRKVLWEDVYPHLRGHHIEKQRFNKFRKQGRGKLMAKLKTINMDKDKANKILLHFDIKTKIFDYESKKFFE